MGEEASRTRLTWFLRILACLGIAHFTISLAAWATAFGITVAKGWASLTDALSYNAFRFPPCVLLLSLFVWPLVIARRRPRRAAAVLVLAFVLSVLLFLYDTQWAGRYQMEILSLSEGGGSHYWTWWWYVGH
jgi:hypothetical protein